jgi:hypothetical protein
MRLVGLVDDAEVADHVALEAPRTPVHDAGEVRHHLRFDHEHLARHGAREAQRPHRVLEVVEEAQHQGDVVLSQVFGARVLDVDLLGPERAHAHHVGHELRVGEVLGGARPRRGSSRSRGARGAARTSPGGTRGRAP